MLEAALAQLGLSKKEIKLYRLLLAQGSMTATELAKASNEKRTNVYSLLEALNKKGVVTEENGTVKKFAVTDPTHLQALLQVQQDQYKQATDALRAALPEIRSQYALITDKPGVIYMPGSQGLLRLLDDMAQSQTELLLVVSEDLPADAATLEEFWKRIAKRHEEGITTRALFHHSQLDTERVREFKRRGMELRFLGEQEFASEMVIYEHNVAFTVFEPALIVTVITNEAISITMRSLFEQLWRSADVPR